MKVVTHSDGGARQGGLIAGAGAVVYDVEGNELAARAHFLQRVTVPQAEYTGLILAFQTALELGATEVESLVDAELIARHLNGIYAVRSEKLKPYFMFAKHLMGSFDRCTVREFPRGGPLRKRRWGNERADQLCNEAMDARSSIPLQPPPGGST